MTEPDISALDTRTSSLLLLDSAGLWFRAFYGVPDSITGPDGTPVNAIRGFVDMVATLIRRHRPTRMVACLDLDWRPAFRVAAVPSYKAHRVAADSLDGTVEDVPPALSPQIPVILDILAAAGIATGGADGFEADDVMGTLAATERTDPVVVVSGDRDLLQVVTDTPVPCGCCMWVEAWRKPSCTTRSWSRTNTGCPWTVPAPPTPNSRCCAATRRTGYPVSKASGTRPRPGC